MPWRIRSETRAYGRTRDQAEMDMRDHVSMDPAQTETVGWSSGGEAAKGRRRRGQIECGRTLEGVHHWHVDVGGGRVEDAVVVVLRRRMGRQRGLWAEMLSVGSDE